MTDTDKECRAEPKENRLYESPIAPDEPALYFASHDSLPNIFALAAAFNLAAIGFSVWKADAPATVLIFVNLRHLAVAFLTLTAFIFAFGSLASVKTHAWNYFSLARETRSSLPMSVERHYIERCMGRVALWHWLAAWAFNIGATLFLVGLAALLWDIAPSGAYVTLGVLGVQVIVWVVTKIFREQVGSCADKFQRKLQCRARSGGK